MSQTAAAYVHVGPWINWSHGPILGSTLTLSERDGGLLTAFLGIFVTAAGASCWKIMSYALHQHRSPRYPQDGIHHQQQAILRNTETPIGASFELARLIWSWRKHALRSFTQTLPLVALAIFNFVLFGLAGVFSSEVTKAAGNETLIRSSDCGSLNFTNIGSHQASAAIMSVDVNDTLAATTYSRACYGNLQNLLQCTQNPQQQLPWTVNQNATCPFTNDLCFYGDSSAYEMDTGHIDSHQALGINAPKSERVQYRKVTTCSPIHTEAYARLFNDTNPTEPASGDTLEQFDYGPFTPRVNHTYEYDTHNLLGSNSYSLTSIVYFAGASTNAWKPVDALNRTDADVSLFLLAPNSVFYEAPVTDPFYAATAPSQPINLDGSNLTYYTSNQLVYALACTDQHQYCNPTNKQCTPLTSVTLASHSVRENKISLNQAQMVTVSRLDLITYFLTTFYSVHSRGANALRASETVNDLDQVALPNNQWMTEVSSWFAVSMAKLQQRVIQYATGPGYIPDGMYLSKPTKMQEKMCKNQFVKSSRGTISFSVLGLAIILILGATLISTSLMLATVMEFLRQWLKWKDYKSLQWTLDGKLQLQRLAYEEAGQGHWSGGANSVTLMKKGDLIGVPEGVDTKHPRLGRGRRYSESRSVSIRSPENESLMGDKESGFGVEPVAMHHG
ncbi:MAG: hypothetical protein ASARMPRED_000319 [Alectoria sarmentosa]|nr:MAG: hypothetical protein ASARMPRED_000319 [Alectoria sarmentosa]